MLSLVFIVIAVFIYVEQEFFSISIYRTTTDKLSLNQGPLRVIQLSDLHAKRFGSSNQRLIQTILRLNPDMIVVTGDMVTSTDQDGKPFLEVAQALVSKCPIFYIEGNHELTAKYDTLNKENKWYDYYLQTLKEIGVCLLVNEKKKIMIDQEEIMVYGLTVPLTYYHAVPSEISKQQSAQVEEDLSDVFPPVDKQSFNILLAHQPFLASLYEAYGFDQVYCGHVHGGVIRLPFLGGLLSPERKFFPKYSEGIYQLGETKMIVSRGLGRFRLFNRPEIVVVEMTSQ
ncbi:MAG: metallophosphoesterase [Turicibacter sp.]|nr:metallophosphoesterase [Turicibacter sp.]